MKVKFSVNGEEKVVRIEADEIAKAKKKIDENYFEKVATRKTQHNKNAVEQSRAARNVDAPPSALRFDPRDAVLRLDDDLGISLVILLELLHLTIGGLCRSLGLYQRSCPVLQGLLEHYCLLR